MKSADGNQTSRFPISIFWIVLGTLLLTASIQVAILIGMDRAGWTPIIKTHVMVLYWLSVSALLTLVIRARMKAVYDAPMLAISEATKKVAQGDFSVHIDPIHSKEHEDYLDKMIHDLNTMISELGSIETLKTDFVSNVSHEIKTPLAAIQNYSSLLCSDNISDDERREYANLISDSAGRLTSLITNILRLNRLENQRIRPLEETFDLSRQLTECLLGFESVWEEKSIEIEPDIEDGIMVRSDRELLSIVWNNLLSNAFKFTEQGGCIGIALHRQNDHAVVTVRDSGCGMDQETVRHIFDKFYQGDTSHSTQGNGLGLALVKRVIDITGGEITVKSAPGEGSTFTVKIKL